MRVIAGSAKGRKLVAPRGSETRPALAKVKEAIFSILGPIEGNQVLDLFAGTGSIGIEALSRDAKHVTFVENGGAALKALHRNIELCRFQGSATTLSSPVDRTLKRLAQKKQKFDLIFVDPPYDQGLVQSTLEPLDKVLADKGTVVVETSQREGIQETEALQITDQRSYGQTRITFLGHR